MQGEVKEGLEKKKNFLMNSFELCKLIEEEILKYF